MVGSKGAVGAALIMVAIGLSGCTALGDDGTTTIIAAPAWKAGFSWAYNYEYNTTWEESYDGDTESDYYSDDGSYILQVLNTTMDIDGIPVYVSVRQEDSRWEQPVAHRRADLAEIWLDYDYSYCRDGDCENELELTSYQEDEEIATHFDFPLSKGKKWSEIVTEDDFIDFEIAHSSRVTDVRLYESPELGEIKVAVIESTIQLANADEALEAYARAWEEEEGVTVHEMRGDFKSKIIEYYSPVYQNVVYRHETFESSFYADLSEDGERGQFSEDGRSTDIATLTGASLVAGPEQGISGIVGYITGNIEIVSPVGEVVEEPVPITYSISIETVRDDANVMDQEALDFLAQIDGDLPDGHQISWTAVNSNGNVIADGAGSSFSFAPSKPGSYLIAVKTTAASEMVAQAFTSAVAHYAGTLTVTCGLAEVAGNGVPDDCASEQIPVHPGVMSLSVEATTASPADSANMGTIRVTDAVGRSIDADDAGNAKALSIEDFEGMALTDAAWGLDWYQTAGAGEQQVEMLVDIQYGRLETSEFPMPAEPLAIETPWAALKHLPGHRHMLS